MEPVTLTLGDEEYCPRTSNELRAKVLAYLANRRFAEVWVRTGDAFQMSMLVNGARAWLMYLVNTDQECWHTRARESVSDDAGMVEFTLANGQVDEYPAKWTIATAEALTGIEHFFDTRQRLQSLEWERDF